jgi:hypothetical protein
MEERALQADPQVYGTPDPADEIDRLLSEGIVPIATIARELQNR